MTPRRRAWAAALVAVASPAAFLLAGPAPAAVAAPAPSGAVSWLAAGDSYSSGEGIPGTGMDGPTTCARSTLAYGPKAASILSTQRGWRVQPLAFPACTGATLDEFYNSGAGHHDPQIAQALASHPDQNRFDVVTMSFGGNDIGFADILEGCLVSWGKTASWTGLVNHPGPSCDIDLAQMNQRSDDLYDGKSTAHPGANYGPGKPLTLPQFYESVVRDDVTARGTLVVVGYPRLFADPSTWPDWMGRSCAFMDAPDAATLNDAADHLNQKIRDAVDAADQALGSDRVEFIDRARIFAGHELCAGGGTTVEYLNGPTAERIEHSFHPNAVAHQVTAEQVAGSVADYFARTAAPTPPPTTQAPPTQVVAQPPTPPPVTTPPTTSSPAPIGDGTSHFDVGDPFSSACVVAWPSAPTYTNDSIVMTMSCQATPGQFLFTQVTYGDPNLPITPSTGTVQVSGTIAGYARSAYGYKELLVQANRVSW